MNYLKINDDDDVYDGGGVYVSVFYVCVVDGAAGYGANYANVF